MSKPKRRPQKSEWEERFWCQLVESGTPLPLRQHQFARCVNRKFQSDFFWDDERLIVEIDGGMYSNGRHNTGKGREEDMERDAIAYGLGITTLRFSPKYVRSGWALAMTRVALGLQDMTREMTRAKKWR